MPSSAMFSETHQPHTAELSKPVPSPAIPANKGWVDFFSRIWRELLHDGLDITVEAYRGRGLFLTCLGILVAVSACAVMQHDAILLKAIRVSRSAANFSSVDEAARWLSYWGDFLGFNVVAFLVLGLAAMVRNSSFLRMVVIASMLGTIIAGGASNLVRFTAGRARPVMRVEPGFYGPRLDAGYHGFPSAHTATAFGASVPVAIALPPVGIPMMLMSCGVAWSRIQNNRHYPADILAAFGIACVGGAPLGFAARRWRRSHQRDNP